MCKHNVYIEYTETYKQISVYILNINKKTR